MNNMMAVFSGLVGIFIGALLVSVTLITNNITIDLDAIIAAAAAFIAACALFLTLWQTYSIQLHNRLSVRPDFSTLSSRDENENYISYTLKNSGLGPAFIKSYKFMLGDMQITDDSLSSQVTKQIIKLLNENGFDTEVCEDLAYTKISAPMIWPNNFENRIFALFFKKSLPENKKIDFAACEQILKNYVHLQIEYEDGYQNKFIFDEPF
jgi:hypothetical protein